MAPGVWDGLAFDLVESGPRTPSEHMAIDQVLLEALGRGERGPSLRFWDWSAPAVVLGSFQSLSNEVDVAAAQRHGMEMVRRISGGGTMFCRPGDVLTYSLVVPGSLVAGMSFVESYAFLDAWAVETLHELGIQASYVPVNDIVGPHGKIAGAAQKRLASGAVLHHTTMAYAIDDAAMREVLSMGRQNQAAKGVKSANKPVDPLNTQSSLSRQEIVDALREHFTSSHPTTHTRLGLDEDNAVQRLVAEKFANPEWTYRVP